MGKIKSYNAALQSVLSLLDQSVPPSISVVDPLPLRNLIRFEGVRFRYAPDQHEVLQGLDFEIRSGERIGLIGGTGTGKSTTVDLLMGLLEPTSGSILVDGKDLHDKSHPERLVAWRASIAHVPQNIYWPIALSQRTLHLLHSGRLIFPSQVGCSTSSNCSFYESSLEGYESFVGERGIRLSGGQPENRNCTSAL